MDGVNRWIFCDRVFIRFNPEDPSTAVLSLEHGGLITQIAIAANTCGGVPELEVVELEFRSGPQPPMPFILTIYKRKGLVGGTWFDRTRHPDLERCRTVVRNMRSMGFGCVRAVVTDESGTPFMEWREENKTWLVLSTSGAPQ